MLRLAFSFNGTLNHFIANLDGFVEVFKNTHMIDIPIISCFHFFNSETEVIIEFLSNPIYSTETIFFTGVLFFHLIEFRFETFHGFT